jgi:FkbM family methyltransferase
MPEFKSGDQNGRTEANPLSVAPPQTAGKPRMKNRFFADCKKHLPHFAMTTVFDVGANIGQTTESVLHFYPDSRIFAFEPVAATFAQYSERFGQQANVVANHAALGSQCAVANVTAMGTSTGNALTQKAGTNARPVESIEVLTGDVFCERNGVEHISYLKVDTEGFDLEVLKGFHRMIGGQHIDLIQVEASMNPFNKRHVDFATFRGYLETCNYYLFGIYDQVHERRGRPMLRRSNPVFIARNVVDANTVGRALVRS